MNLLNRNTVWNTALLEAYGNIFDISNTKELKIFSSRMHRTSRYTVHTQTDPFLFVEGNWLYIFLETQRVDRQGEIEAWRTCNLKDFDHLGIVLSLPHHVSFPQVFRSDAGIHMLPETQAANEVALFTFDDFPFGLRKERVLLQGSYYDSVIYKRDGIWWLFSTSNSELELFFLSELNSKIQNHSVGVISRDLSNCRGGGSLINWDGKLYRPAQNCSQTYGGNLGIMEIVKMNTDEYSEVCVHTDIFDRSAKWRSEGAHHLSFAKFNGCNILAVDGLQQDYWSNRPLSLALKLIS